MTITTAEPITLPGFDPRFIPSAQKPRVSPHLRLAINRYVFRRDPFGDKLSRQLTLSITIDNQTDKQVSFLI